MNNEHNEIETVAEQSAAEPKKSPRAKRHLRYRIGFSATIAIAVVAVILLNVIVGVVADRFPITWDMSKNKTYSLSEQSIEIAKQVKDKMQLVIFFDEESFSNPNTSINELDTTLREFYNALKQYNTNSGGKITYTFIEPNQQPQKFAAYSKYKVKQGDMLFIYGDRYKVRTIYNEDFSNDLFHLDMSNYYTYGTYSLESNAEKMLASTIHSLNSGKEHIIQVLTGHEEDSQVIDGLKGMYELNGYTFEELVITGSVDFNKDADTMLIAAPEKDYSAAEIKRIQEWVSNDNNYGRQLMVFVSPTADCPNLYEFLEVEYQITVTDELIVETDMSRIQNYSYLLTMTDIKNTVFSEKSSGSANVYTPVTRRLTTTLPSSLEDSIGSYAVTITNYPKTAKLSKLADLMSDTSDSNSYYSAKEEEYPLTGMIVCAIDSYNNDTGEAVDGRVLVCGSSAMAYAAQVQNTNFKNEDLLLEVTNGITGVENAIAISGKIVENETVSFNNTAQIVLGLGIFTVGLPIAILVVCLVVFLRRKNL